VTNQWTRGLDPPHHPSSTARTLGPQVGREDRAGERAQCHGHRLPSLALAALIVWWHLADGFHWHGY
jgi:hypothetical protein